MKLVLKSSKFPIQQLPYYQFNQIIHLSDIHVRPLTRHDEYRTVFQRVYQNLESYSNYIIVITGDIFDSKFTFKPETYMIVGDFIRKLTQYAPLLIIPGNHDMCENNISRLDSLTPITQNIPNLHYLIKTGIYLTGNYAFVTSSLYDKQFIRKENLPDEINTFTKIYLYHGTVVGATNDHGFTFQNPIEISSSTRYRSVSDFNGFDYVLLGDIHKRQFIKPHIGYAGSLLQQNFGESNDNHGYIIWDLINQKHQCIDIPNEHSYVTLEFNNGELVSRPDAFTPYTTLNIKLNNTPRLDMTKILLEQISPVTKYEINKIIQHKQQSINNSLPKDIDQICEIELIRQELSNEPEMIPPMIELHQTYQKDALNDPSYQNSSVWKPVWMKFKNMFGYSGNLEHHVHFHDGTTIISAQNRTGKTSIIKTLLFAIYGDTIDRVNAFSTTYDIINNNSNEGYVNILIDYGNKFYLIERQSLRNRSQKRGDYLSQLQNYDFTCNIYESDEHGQKINNITTSKAKNNDAKIHELFGELKEFSISNVIDRRGSCVTDMKERDLIERLKSIYRIKMFDIYKHLNDDILKQTKAQINDLNKIIDLLESQDNVKSEDSSELKTQYEQLLETINALQSQITQINQQQRTIEFQINDQRHSLHIIDGDEPLSTDEIEQLLVPLGKPELSRQEVIVQIAEHKALIQVCDQSEKDIVSGLEKLQKPEFNYDELKTALYNIHEELGKLDAQRKIIETPTKSKEQLQEKIKQIMRIYPKWHNRHFDIETCQRKINALLSHQEPVGSLETAQIKLANLPEMDREQLPVLQCKFNELNDVPECQEISESLNLDADITSTLTQINNDVCLPQDIIIIKKELQEALNRFKQIQKFHDNPQEANIDLYQNQLRMETTQSSLQKLMHINCVPKPLFKLESMDPAFYSKQIVNLQSTQLYQIADDDLLISTQLEKIRIDYELLYKQLPNQINTQNYITFLDQLLIGEATQDDAETLIPPIKRLLIDYSEGFKLLHQLDELKNQITELSSRLEEIQRQLQHNEYIQKTLKHNRAIETVINYLNYSQKVDLQTKLNKYQEQITQAQQSLEYFTLQQKINQNQRLISQWDLRCSLTKKLNILQWTKKKQLLKKINLIQKHDELSQLIQQHHDHLDRLNKIEKLRCQIKLMVIRRELQICDEYEHNMIIDQQIQEALVKQSSIREQLDTLKQFQHLNDQLTVIQSNHKHQSILSELQKQSNIYELLDRLEKRRYIQMNTLIEDNIKTLEKELHQVINQKQLMEKNLSLVQEKAQQIQIEITRHNFIEKQKVDRRLKINHHITDLKQLQQRLVILEKYNQLVSSNGIPKKKLIQYLTQIEEFVNSIISISTCYKLKIGYDPDKNSIYFIMINTRNQKGLSLKSLSGMESVVTKLAIKAALNKYSHNAKSGIIIVDEAIDSFDNNNIDQMLPTVIRQILNDYDQILLISQHDISQVANHTLEIARNNGISVIHES